MTKDLLGDPDDTPPAPGQSEAARARRALGRLVAGDENVVPVYADDEDSRVGEIFGVISKLTGIIVDMTDAEDQLLIAAIAETFLQRGLAILEKK